MSAHAIQVEGLSKRYKLGARTASYRTFGEALAGTLKAPLRWFSRSSASQTTELWALRDVSFDVAPGTVLGVIGRNGAGKSTLLKLLSRISEPTSGRAVIRGRVGSLLEVGTGFHPELSGRENIFLNGAILGMQRSDIVRRFDEIVAFAEVEKFLDTAVKHYSSGMYLRLAFSVAAHLEPEILFVDEVLAVGDQAFQAKCLGKMGEVAGQGRTVLFVSHNLAAIRALCTDAILLRDGQLALRGSPTDVINQYLVREAVNAVDLSNTTKREGDGSVRLTQVVVRDHIGQAGELVHSGAPMSIELSYEMKASDADSSSALVFHIFLRTMFGDRLFTCSTRYAARAPTTYPTRGTIRCTIDRLPLAPGQYAIDIAIKHREVTADQVLGVKLIQVGEGDFWGSGKMPAPTAGPFLVDHSFEVHA